MRGQGLPRSQRLKRRCEFQHAYGEGHRIVSPYFVAFAVANEVGALRVGVVASRRVGGAVARNRAKRLLREVFRRRRSQTSAAADLVLVAREAIGRAAYVDLEGAYDRFVGRILGKIARGRSAGGDPA